MHEAGLAAAIADAVQRAGPLDGATRVRLLVTGGHDDPEAFDDALRLHLHGQAPDVASAVDIVHVAVERLCLGCGGAFDAVRSDEPCPGCGGSAMPLPVPERVDVELVRNVQ